MSRDEDMRQKRVREAYSSDEYDDEDEDEDVDENEEQDEEEEETEVENSGPGWKPQSIPPSDEERGKVRHIRDILNKEISEIRILRELRKCDGDMERALSSLLDGRDGAEVKESFYDRERRQLYSKYEEIERNGPADADAACNTIRSRLLWGDNRLPWLDGALVVLICRKSMQETNGMVPLLSKAQQNFLHDCLVKSTSIMLDQEIHPSAENYFCASALVDDACAIALQAFVNNGDASFLEVIALCLNPAKNLWRSPAGSEEYNKRHRLISSQESLLAALTELLSGPWPGADTVAHALMALRLLSAVAHAIPLVRVKLSTITIAEQSLKTDRALENVLREILLAIQEDDEDDEEDPEEDVVSRDFAAMRAAARRRRLDNFFHFWLVDVALRLFQTTNLEQRLYGLSQIERLLDACSPVSSVLVGGEPWGKSSPRLGQSHHYSSFGFKSMTSPHGSDRDTNADLQESTLARWLVEIKLFSLLVDENRVHSEILSRSKRIVKFMVARLRDVPELFPSEYFVQMWRLGVSQHESIRQVVLDLLVEALEESPPIARQGLDFLEFLQNVPADQLPFVVDFLSMFFRRKIGVPALVSTTERARCCFELVWDALHKAPESLLEKCYGLFTELLNTDAGRRNRVTFLERCMSEIQNPRMGSLDSFRFLTLFHKVIDLATLETLLEGPQVSRATVNEEPPSLIENPPARINDTTLVDLLIRDLELHKDDKVRAVFRVESMVFVFKLLSGRRNNSFQVRFDHISKVTRVLADCTDLVFLFLNRLLASRALVLPVISETFVKIICPGWKEVSAAEMVLSKSIESSGDHADQPSPGLGLAWQCFQDFFEELRKTRVPDPESGDTEDALRLGRECVWEVAMEPFANSFVANEAVKLAIEETSHLEDEIPKILSRLRRAEFGLRQNPDDAAARGMACRCLAVLCHFAESERYVKFDIEPIPHACATGGNVLKVSLQVNNGPIVDLVSPTASPSGQPVNLWQQTVSVTTCVRDLVLLIKHDLHVPSLQLFLNNHDVTQKWWTPLETFQPANHLLTGMIVLSKKRSGQINPSLQEQGSDAMETEEMPKSARMILARSDALFDLLHDIQCLQGCPPEVSGEVDKLLQTLPSRRSLVALLSSDGAPEFWQTLLSSPNHACNVYRLEVVNSLIHPSGTLPTTPDTKAFRVRFTSMGGLRTLVDFFTKNLFENVHQSEVAFDGHGFKAALRTINFCFREIAAHEDLLHSCLLSLQDIIQIRSGRNLVLDELASKWNGDTLVTIIFTATMSLILLLGLKETPSDLDLVHEIVKSMVDLMRTVDHGQLREYLSRALDNLAKNALFSEMIWEELRNAYEHSDKPEIFRGLWMVWTTKRASSSDLAEAASLLNHSMALAQSILAKMDKFPHLVDSTSLYYLFEMMTRMLPDRTLTMPPPPPGTIAEIMPTAKRYVSITMLNHPELFIEWLMDRIVFSSVMSRHKALIYHASLLAMQLCLTKTNDDVNELAQASICRTTLCQSIQSRMEVTPRVTEWCIDPDQVLRSADTGYVGLVNQGATCYMNSLLQQFFMSPCLRAWITSETPLSLEDPRANLDVDKAQARDILEQVQRVFTFLQRSTRRFVDPRDLVESCKTLNLSNPVHQQNDARDLCDKLVDRIEIALKTMGIVNPTQACFGGQVVHQNIKRGCPHPSTERANDFIALELQIKGKHTLENSLRDFCAGEVLDGENRVQCDECDQKYPALLRECLADNLPKVLVLHLKRFQLDYDTFETVKLNDRLSFPSRLDVGPFTRDGLIRLERGEVAQEQAYDLCGVLVHRGVAGGGHYYSFAKDRETGKWFRFNDEKVTPFDEKRLDEECFGGRSDGHAGPDGDTNAYMLFYEKVEPSDSAQPVTMTTTEPGQSDRPRTQFESEVDSDNQTVSTQLVLCSPELGNTLLFVLDHSLEKSFLSVNNLDTTMSARGVDRTVADVGLNLCLDWVIHTNNAETFERWVSVLVSLATHDENGWFACELLDRVTKKVRETVQRCRAQTIRRNFLKLAAKCAAAPQVKTESLASFLSCLLDLLPETSKSAKLMTDVSMCLRDSLAESPRARKLMRDEEESVSLKHGVAKLIHLVLGDSESPFTERDKPSEIVHTDAITALLEADSPGASTPTPPPVSLEVDSEPQVIQTQQVDEVMISGDLFATAPSSMVTEEEEEEEDEMPKLKPLGWTWTDRLVRWNAAASQVMSISVLSNSAPPNASLNGNNIAVFDNLFDSIGFLITPHVGLPLYLAPLLSAPEGKFYQRAIRESQQQGAVKDWLVELCRADGTGISAVDRKSTASYRIILDLLNFITKWQVGLDPDVEMSRYDSCLQALTDILNIEDSLQTWRILLSLRPDRAVQEPQSMLRPVATYPLVNRTTSPLARMSTNMVEGLFLACSPAMKKFWGPALQASTSSAFRSVTSTTTPTVPTVHEANLFRMIPGDVTFCERHARTLARMVMEVSAFSDVLKRVTDAQKKELAIGEDDLTRLVYWFAGKSFDPQFGGEIHHHYDPTKRTRKRSVEADRTLQALAPIASIRSPYVCGRVWNANDPLVVDESNRYLLGPSYLFDDKCQFAAVFAYLVDYPVKKTGTIVEFCARMGHKFVRDNTTSASADDGFICVVVGRRPGDATVRMREEAIESNSQGLRVFDRVMIRSQEVFRKRAELMNRQRDKERQAAKEEQSPKSTTAQNSEDQGTPTKKLKVETTTNLQGPSATPPRITATATATATTTTTATKTPTTTTLRMNDQPVVVHAENMHGVIVKICENKNSKRTIVVRMDSTLGGPSSEHSQLIELDHVPDDDTLVLEFPEEVVYSSDQPLSLMDHQFTITRTAPIPSFNYSESRVVHHRPLEVPVFPGERVGVARLTQLGLAWSTWHEFDRHSFSYYFASKAIVAKEGSVLGTQLVHEIKRPAFNFKITTLDGGMSQVVHGGTSL